MAEMSIKKATIINMIGKYSNVIIQLIINAILARLLSPDDFGIVAIITVFTNFFLVLSDMGISTGVIQRKDLTEDDTNVIFSFTIILGIILGILFAFLGFLIAKFYNNYILISLCVMLSISVFFNTINMVPNAILLKNMEFVSLAIRTILVNIIVGITTIILAFIGFKYYSLIINSILVSILTFILTFRKAPLKVTYLQKDPLKRISSISSYQFYFSFVNYFSRNLDNLTIGKFLGPSPLGYYDKAYKLMLYPNTMLTGIISTSLHPILSNYAEKPDIILKKYVDVLKFTLFIGVPTSVLCFLASNEIVLILYGNQWINVTPIIQMLSLSLLVQLCMSSSGAIFQSLGKTKELFYIGLLNTLILSTFILVSIFCSHSLIITGLGVSIGYNITFITTYYFLIKLCFKQKFKDFFNELKVYFIFYLILILLSLFFKDAYIINPIISIFVKGIFLMFVYLCMIYFSKEKKWLYYFKERK